MLRKTMLLATVVALVLSAAAMALASSPGDGKASTKGSLGKNELGKNKDFAGLVDIGGGRKMYMECHGRGSPTVVLVSGGADAYDVWTYAIDSGGEPKPSGSAVFPKVGKFTRVCAYDRPGTMRADGTLSPSTPVRQPTTAQEGAADLHALLGAAKQKGPYAIVAHSWGGLISRLYASTYPDEVSGLVLLDPASEFLQETLTPAQWATFVRQASFIPKPVEATDYPPSVRALRAAPPVRGIPAVVLSSDKCWFTLPGFDAGETCSAWNAAQDLLAAHLDAKHITDTNSAHNIHVENPKLVIDSVREVVGAVRKSEQQRCTLTGTRGSDTLQGTGRDDMICGLGGADTLMEAGGEDVLRGDGGPDALTGGPGPDELLGGAGTDALLAVDGVRHNDIMHGGADRDSCRGDRGDVKSSCR